MNFVKQLGVGSPNTVLRALGDLAKFLLAVVE
jgi:hypothetical protein